MTTRVKKITAVKALVIKNPSHTDGINMDAFSKAIREIFAPVKFFDKFMDNILSPESMKLWVASITHQSFNPDVKENYELYETVGDKIGNTCFMMYAMKNATDCTSQMMTNLLQYYMSKNNQGEWEKKYLKIAGFMKGRISKLHLIEGELPEKIHEDVFESFFGVLWMIGEKITTGLGSIFCSTLLNYIFQDTKIDYSITHAKFAVEQLMKNLKLKKPEMSYMVHGDVKISELVLDDETVLKIKKLGIILSEKKWQVSSDPREDVKFKIYQMCLDSLTKDGITKEWVDKVKEIDPYAKSAIEKMNSYLTLHNLKSFHIQHTEDGRFGKYDAVELVVVNKDNVPFILHKCKIEKTDSGPLRKMHTIIDYFRSK